jgi:replication factor A1
MDYLVSGSLLDLFQNNDFSKPIYLQAHQAKILSDGANRIRMMLNDSKWFVNAVFKPNDKQNEVKDFQRYSILHITDYSISGVNGKYFILIEKCQVVGIGEQPQDSKQFQSLDQYLKENPDLNLYQKKTDELANNNNNNNTVSAPPPAPASNTPTPTPPPSTSSSSSAHTTTNSNLQQKDIKQSNPVSKNKDKSIKDTINDISPYNNDWTIKARVSYKSDLRTWKKTGNEGKLFSVNLMDETGEIKATAFNAAADKFFDLLQENNVYKISKASLRQANPKFTKLSHAYEMILEKDTIIELIEDDDDVPKVQFNFIKLDEIENLENNAVIDVLGIIKNVGEQREIISKSTGKAYVRRDITIVDQSQSAIDVGLWNKMARDFNLDPGTPIAIKGCKINEFNGKQLSLLPSAIVSPNPDLPDAYKLKGWYDNEGSTESYKNLRTNTNNNSNLTSKESIEQRITILNAHESKLGFNEKPDYLSIKGSISFIKPDNFSYPACSSEGCSKKVIEQSDGTWRCERCSINHTEPLHRYILTVSVVDETGQIWLNLFNEQGEELMGCNAKTLLEMKESSDENLLKNYLTENVLFKEYAFKLRARLDSYQGVDRARFQVLALSETDPSNEADALVDLINKIDL